MSMHDVLESKLNKAFRPIHLEVINESHRHNVPKGSETHFKVIVVSDKFEGMRLVRRHQEVNNLLASELSAGVHALSMETLTSGEWAERGGSTFSSPPCLGGSKAG